MTEIFTAGENDTTLQRYEKNDRERILFFVAAAVAAKTVFFGKKTDKDITNRALFQLGFGAETSPYFEPDH